MKTQINKDVSHRLATFKKQCNLQQLLQQIKLAFTYRKHNDKSTFRGNEKLVIQQCGVFLVTFCPPGAELEALLTRSDRFLNMLRFA